MKALWFFENVNLFNFLCPHKYKEFANEHSFLDYNKGDYIYMEEDKSDKIYLINSGKIKIGYITDDGDEIILAILYRGEIFGEKAIFDNDERNEFAQAIENGTSICSVTQEVMSELLKNNDDFNISIFKFIGYRFKKLERRIQLLLFKDTKTRLKEFIKELSNDFGFENPISKDIIIKHPYSQKEIATLIGTSRPTLNGMLNELQLENYIEFERKQIVLKKS
ncbi:MAG: Crp/Fnr family transcriptional regulator [Flavobacterium sp.]